MKKIIIALASILLTQNLSAQHIALSIDDAEKKGITIEHLSIIYKMALDNDTSKAVFKTDAQQEAMLNAYTKLLQDFGKFLSAHNFKWTKPTRGWNRIYFSTDGSIDYFLYTFPTVNVKPEDQLSEEKQAEFNRLLNLFINDYKFALTAKVKFAQCSPTVYEPK